MSHEPAEIYLNRIDPSQNMARFYTLYIQPNLFGGSSLIREWGRIGTRGQHKIVLYEDVETAQRAKARLERSKRRRGYQTAC